MPSARAPKRRKLDDPSNETSPATGSTPARWSTGKKTTGVPTTDNQSNELSAQEMWKLAKAKGKERDLERRRKSEHDKSELDLYDDIEGANLGQEPWGRLDRPQKRALSHKHQNIFGERAKEQKTEDTRSRHNVSNGHVGSSPSKKSLDPLRNQRLQNHSSPRKPSASLGFFKKFAKARTEETPTVATNAEHQIISELKNAQNGPEDPNALERKADSAARSEKNGQHRAVTDRWTYGKPKKTFEDEIRELEEKARNNAAGAESEDELASNNEARPSSGKRQSLRKPVAEPAVEQKTISGPTPRPKKSLDRRKIRQPDVDNDAAVDSEEILEIPDSEDDVQQVARVDLPRDLEPEEPEATPKKKASRLPKKQTFAVSANFEAARLECIQKVVLEKATGKRAIPITELDTEYTKVSSVIGQTVSAGESNSMLLIGARGSGKTTLINHVLREQAKKHSEEFHVVRLNGFIHTDDKVALRDIWRQLGREMDLDEDEATSKNYADTMSKLLALLSHPAEMGAENPDQTTKSVVFVLDEFELFATHPRQTLLYNLFDIAQSRKAPIVVLGLTTRIDVAESLEKRVKSRFSHRYVHLALPKSLESFKRICGAALTLTPEDLADDEHACLQTNATSNPVNQWNVLVTDFLETETCENFLHRLYYTTKSVPDFLATLILAAATMPVSSNTTATVVRGHFISQFAYPTLQPPDSKLVLLSSLSTIQLALLICAARLTNIYSTEIISFALTYEEYRVLASKAKLQASASGALAQGAGSRVWGKEIAKNAWQELVECGLVIEDGRTGGTGRVDVGLEEIGMSGVDLGQWARWCKEI
ncbi:Origin recognition complex subunit 4 [Lecanosticta acicola]|uniref:Origin recognition complex subunit 4 n=1 Tax=Lecanosticta acicola TaxID=111012 RepID=A0AAI8YZN4_9PEZI|nr:Origin recognition complex subunit 4 [Lecanosticta acicola]